MANTALSWGLFRHRCSICTISCIEGWRCYLTARCAEQLNAHKLEIETKHGVSAHVFALDLTAEVGAADLHA